MLSARHLTFYAFSYIEIMWKGEEFRLIFHNNEILISRAYTRISGPEIADPLFAEKVKALLDEVGKQWA